MTKEFLEILSVIGISGFVVVISFYVWIKKLIIKDIVKPLIEPVEKDIKDLKEELNKKDDKLEKINDTLQKNTETLQELKTIFNLIKGKIEISFKDK